MAHATKKEQKAATSGVESGINALLEANPMFKYRESKLNDYIDAQSVARRSAELVANARQNNLRGDAAFNYIHNGIEEYVSRGFAFNERGKEVLGNKTLEQKANSGFLKGFLSRRTRKMEDYLGKVLSEAYGLRDQMAKDNVQTNDPEVKRFVDYLQKEAGNEIPDMKLEMVQGKISGHRYRSMIRNASRYLSSQTKYARQALKMYGKSKTGDFRSKYSSAENIASAAAAVLFGVSGIGIMIASGLKLTGGVINVLPNSSAGIVGGALILIALLIFMIVFRKES